MSIFTSLSLAGGGTWKAALSGPTRRLLALTGGAVVQDGAAPAGGSTESFPGILGDLGLLKPLPI